MPVEHPVISTALSWFAWLCIAPAASRSSGKGVLRVDRRVGILVAVDEIGPSPGDLLVHFAGEAVPVDLVAAHAGGFLLERREDLGEPVQLEVFVDLADPADRIIDEVLVADFAEPLWGDVGLAPLEGRVHSCEVGEDLLLQALVRGPLQTLVFR